MLKPGNSIYFMHDNMVFFPKSGHTFAAIISHSAECVCFNSASALLFE